MVDAILPVMMMTEVETATEAENVTIAETIIRKMIVIHTADVNRDFRMMMSMIVIPATEIAEAFPASNDSGMTNRLIVTRNQVMVTTDQMTEIKAGMISTANTHKTNGPMDIPGMVGVIMKDGAEITINVIAKARNIIETRTGKDMMTGTAIMVTTRTIPAVTTINPIKEIAGMTIAGTTIRMEIGTTI